MHPSDPVSLGFDPARLSHLRTILEADVLAQRCDGAAVALGRGGQLALLDAVGFAHRDAGTAMAADTVAVSFSVGKQFVNALVLAAVERGDLGLHQPICEVLPEFANRGKDEICVWHLLSHTSGICSGVPPLPPEDLVSIEKVTAFAAASRPEAPPGQRVIYSVLVGHAVLASLLLAVDGGGRSFAQYLEEELFTPLKMGSTSLGIRADLVDRANPVVARYARSGLFHAEEVEGIGALVGLPGSEIPAGGYVTTIADLYAFADLLRGGGARDGFRLLSPAMLDLASRNFTGDRTNSLMDYATAMRRWEPWPGRVGLGFFVRGEGITPGPLPNLGSPQTYGGWGSGTSCIWVDPDRDVCFALLTTGVMEDSDHIERVRRLSDAALAALVA